MTNVHILNNEAEWEIGGEFDLSAAAAVLASRGSNSTVAKTGTGIYTVTIPAAVALPIVELLGRFAQLCGTATLTTALEARVTTVTTDANGNVVITVLTCNEAGAGVDTTAANTVSYRVYVRVNKMGNPL